MKDFLMYQIEVAICIATFSGLFLLLWKKETNFHFKRFLLLSIPLLSVCIPMLNIKLSIVPEQTSYVTNAMEYIVYIPNQIILESGIDTAPQSNDIGIWQLAFCLWSIGALIMLIRLLISYWKILQIYRKSDVAANGDYRLISDPVHSFSFFNLIVLNKSQAATESKEHILAHEQAHSQHYHSFDVVLFETLKMFQWFNPFIWILTRDSKQNMEFIADQLATATDHTKEKYQYAIIHHAADANYQLLKTPFSKSNLKRRIIMMNQPNNHKIHKGKLFLFLPVLGILFMSFSMRVENLDLKKAIAELHPLFSASSSNSAEYINLPLVQKVELSNENQLNAISGNPDTSSSESQAEPRKIGGTIKTESGDPVIGCNIIIKGTHIGTISDGDGRFIIEVGPEDSELVFDYVGLESEIVEISDVVDYKITMKIDETYEDGDKSLEYSIRMGGHLNDSASVKIGRPLTGHGTNIGISRSLDTDSSEYRPLYISNSGKVTIRRFDEIDEDQRPLYMYDGKEISNEEMKKISPDDIESISVLKGSAAAKIYGENAANGVVIINSKDYTMDHPEINNMKSIVRGTVSSENGDAVVGANVTIKGTTTGTVTDKNGHYIVEVGPDDITLIFSIRNMKSKEVSIKNKSEIDVTLENVNK